MIECAPVISEPVSPVSSLALPISSTIRQIWRRDVPTWHPHAVVGM